MRDTMTSTIDLGRESTVAEQVQSLMKTILFDRYVVQHVALSAEAIITYESPLSHSCHAVRKEYEPRTGKLTDEGEMARRKIVHEMGGRVQ